MSYVKVDVIKPADNSGIGGDRKDSILIFDWDDVASGYTRDSKGVVITGPLVFNPGAYMVRVYGTKNTIGSIAKSEGDPDSKGIIQTFKFTHPGNKQAIREFRWYWMNRNCGIIDEKCSTSDKDMYGSPCAPLQMQFEAKNDKDANNADFTFESVNKGPDVAVYQGTYTLAAVMGTPAADDTSPDVDAGEGQYQLTSGSVAAVKITKLDNPDDGFVYTLLGSGGAHPSTIEDGDDFLLASGTTWTATAGAMITFKCFKDGAATYKFIEVSRS